MAYDLGLDFLCTERRTPRPRAPCALRAAPLPDFSSLVPTDPRPSSRSSLEQILALMDAAVLNQPMQCAPPSSPHDRLITKVCGWLSEEGHVTHPETVWNRSQQVQKPSHTVSSGAVSRRARRQHAQRHLQACHDQWESVRQARLVRHADAFSQGTAVPLSEEHAQALLPIWTTDPLLAATSVVELTEARLTDPIGMAPVDVTLLAFWVAKGLPSLARRTWSGGYYLADFGRRLGQQYTLLERAARVLRPEILAQFPKTQVPIPARRQDSLLWTALMCALPGDRSEPMHWRHRFIRAEMNFEQWRPRLEATVNWILANENDRQADHRGYFPADHWNILNLAIEAAHPASDWLKERCNAL
jgi:hypothetical protein